MTLRKKLKETSSLEDGVFCAFVGGGVKSGGGIAVLDFCESKNIQILGLSGSSIGAVTAALKAKGCCNEEILFKLQMYVQKFTEAFKKNGGDGIIVLKEEFDKEFGTMTFKDLQIPCTICATQIFPIIKPVMFNSENDVLLADAITASCAFPGLLGSFRMGNKIYVDGGFFGVTNPPIICAEKTIVASFYGKAFIFSPLPHLKKIPEKKVLRSGGRVVKPDLTHLGTGGSKEDIQNAYDRTMKKLMMGRW